MGCQKGIARQIVQQGGDYVLAVQDNHPTRHQDVQDTFRYAAEDGYHDVVHGHAEQVEKAHGRIETRRFTLITEPEYLAYLDPKRQWRGLAAVGVVEAERQIGTETTTEHRYSLTSHTDVARFAAAARCHWGIENRGHWVLDVVFHEDQRRIRVGNADQKMPVLRHIAMNMVCQESSKGSMRVKRKQAGWDNDYLRTILGLCGMRWPCSASDAVEKVAGDVL